MEREEWKIGVFGVPGVGAMAFVTQQISQHFVEEYDPTIGEDSYRKQSMIDDQVCVYELLPFRYEPERQFNAIFLEQVMLQVQGFILAYSHTNRSSFERIPTIVERILRVKDITEDEMKMVPMVIIETKCDLAEQREVSIEEGHNLAQRYGAAFFSTSAKCRINVEEAVFELIRILRRRRDATPLKKKKIKHVKVAKPAKKVIPKSIIHIQRADSTLVDDIQKYLLDVEKYSDLVLTIGDRKIHVHKAVLFSRLPSFMEKIKPTDKDMDLSDLNYSVVLSIMKYLYTGKFKRENFGKELYKPAIMKLEVFNLLPILKADHVDIEGFDPKFERLFNLNFLSDLKIVAKDLKNNQREIFCHKMILCARSNYFRTMYHGGFKDSDAAELVVEDCSYEAMLFLIEYYYLSVDQIKDESIACDVLRIAHRYDEKPVVQLVEIFFLENLSIENVCFVLMLCDLFSLSEHLKSACEEFISYRHKKVSKTSAFKKLSAEVQKLLELYRRNNGPYDIPKQIESIILLKQLKSFTL